MRYKILGVFAALTVVSACGDLTSINQNPNGPTDVPPPSIIGQVIQTIVGNVDGVNSLNIRGGGLWSQYYSHIQYRDEARYIVRSGTSGGWGLYSSALTDIKRMYDKGQASNAPNWTAVSRILKAYTYSVMTDAMGELSTAVGEFDFTPGVPGFETGDLMYGGNLARWRKFANSLRLRLAIHVSQVDPAKAASEAAAAVAGGVFSSNLD